MAEKFICVTQQILLLAAIILVGFALSKANLISAEGEMPFLHWRCMWPRRPW